MCLLAGMLVNILPSGQITDSLTLIIKLSADKLDMKSFEQQYHMSV